jgi:hypothetical protein
MKKFKDLPQLLSIPSFVDKDKCSVGVDIIYQDNNTTEVFTFCVGYLDQGIINMVHSETIVNNNIQFSDLPSKHYIEKLSKFYGCDIIRDK